MGGAEAGEKESLDAPPAAGLRLWSAAYAPGHVLRLRRGAWLAAPLRLALTCRPSAPVTVRLLVRGPGEAAVTVEPREVTFSSAEWYVPTTISLRAAGGDGSGGGGDVVGDPPPVLWLDVASADAEYDGVAPPPLAVELLPREGEPGPLCTAEGTHGDGGSGGGDGSVGGGGSDSGGGASSGAIARLGLSSPAVLALGGGGILFRELSEPDGCPSPTEVAMLPAGARAADAISTPGWVAAALLPAGRYALRGGAWHRMLDPAAACAALWRATAAHTLSCGDIVQWPATPAAGLPAAVPRWVAEAGGGSHASPRWVDGEGAAGAETGPGLAIGGPPLLDLDGDGRPELLLRVFIAPGVTSFSIDTCGSASDGRIRLFAGCPWGGGALALSRPLLEDGDSGTVERCRAPLHEVTAEAGAGVRRLSRGNDAVVWSARMQGMVAGGTAATGASPSAGTSLPPGAPLLPGEYWLAVDSDAEQEDLASGGRLRVTCARDEVHAAPSGVADPCFAAAGGCRECTALTACGWCSGPSGSGECLAGRAEGPLLAACGGAWVPFADRCESGAAAAAAPAPLRLSAEVGAGGARCTVPVATAAAAVLLLAAPLVSLLLLRARRRARRGVTVARNTAML